MPFNVAGPGFGGRGTPNPLPNVNTLYGGRGSSGMGLGAAFSALLNARSRRRPEDDPLPQPPQGQPPSLDPNINIYKDYPGFDPMYWHGDSLTGLDRRRGAGQDRLRELSDTALRVRGLHTVRPQASGIGFGVTDPMSAFRKLLQARQGAM